jgi:hypothetical protein
MWVHAADISQIAYYMCYLQLTWRGIPAYVERADTLRMEHFEGAWTIGIHMFTQYHEEQKQEKRVIELAKAFQLLLRDMDSKPDTISLRPELAMLRWSAINRRWCIEQTKVITP